MAKKRKLESTGADRSELRRLLQAAKADHWDDGPRLAIADWLEEHGGESDRARAEVIRLQLEARSGGIPWSNLPEAIRKKHVRDWLPTQRAFFRFLLPRCESGLLRAEVGAGLYASDGPADEAWEWVETASPSALNPESLAALLRSGRFATVPRLLVRPMGRSGLLPVLADHFRPGPGRALRTWATAAEVGVLARLAPGIDELDLTVQWGQPRWADLLPSRVFAGLRALSLRGGNFGDAEAEALRSLPHLRRLALGNARLTATGLRSLASLPLRRLEFAGGVSLAPLGDGPCAGTLEELSLANCPPGAWPASMPLPRLRRLTLGGCGLPPAVAGMAGQLRELVLRGPFDPEALPGAGPRSLRLEACGLGDEGLARLASWPGLAEVRFLGLRDNGLTEGGLSELGNSPHAAQLEGLDLRSNPIANLADFLRSPVGMRLRLLDVRGTSVADRVAASLEQARPPALREVQSFIYRPSAALRAALPGCAIG